MSNKRQEKKPPSRADQMMAARLEASRRLEAEYEATLDPRQRVSPSVSGLPA